MPKRKYPNKVSENPYPPLFQVVVEESPAGLCEVLEYVIPQSHILSMPCHARNYSTLTGNAAQVHGEETRAAAHENPWLPGQRYRGESKGRRRKKKQIQAKRSHPTPSILCMQSPPSIMRSHQPNYRKPWYKVKGKQRKVEREKKKIRLNTNFWVASRKSTTTLFFLGDQDDVIHGVKSKRRSIVMCKT